MELKENKHKKSRVRNASPKALYVDMGRRLRMLRFELDYTQEQMAEILEMSLAYYGKVERGLYGLSLEKLIIVNSKFNMDINYLLTGNKMSEISLQEIYDGCPSEHRYDLEQLIKYAIKLAKGNKEN